MTVEILQTGKLLASCEAALGTRYTVHKLHEQADPKARLAESSAYPRPCRLGRAGRSDGRAA
ncbi:hypothetical protein N8D56_24350 [Devosia sp. A8/3-2]|nr:hypothetical protein N8D56_24350 [Devosia sp. A8/3-2]